MSIIISSFFPPLNWTGPSVLLLRLYATDKLFYLRHTGATRAPEQVIESPQLAHYMVVHLTLRGCP